MISDEKVQKPKDSKPLEMKLDFEDKIIEFEDGQLFDPLKDATRRWIGTRHTRLPYWGLTCEVLYLTHESNWVLAVAQSCIRQKGIWLCCHDYHFRFVVDREAWEYFLDFKLTVPKWLEVRNDELLEQLKAYYSSSDAQIADVEERSLWSDFRGNRKWLQAVKNSSPTYCPLHEFNLDEYLRLFGDCLIDLTQDIKRWFSGGGELLSEDSRKLVPLLIGGLAVDKHKWDWNCGRIPPESLDILEIEWEADTLKLQEALRWFRAEFLNPLCCLEMAMHVSQQNKPSDTDLHIAKCVLFSYLADIEEITLEVNQLVNLIHAQQDLDDQEPEDLQLPESVTTEVEEVLESEQADDADEEQESMGPVLRIVRDGFHYNGQFQKLTPKPLRLLRLMANSPGGMVTFVRAQDIVWEETSIEPNAINRTVSKIRAAIRACLFLSDSVDPIPCKGTGRNSSWKLGFQFQLIDESESWN